MCTGNIQASGIKKTIFVGASSNDTQAIQASLIQLKTPTISKTTAETSFNNSLHVSFNNTPNVSINFENFWGTEVPITRPSLPLQYSRSHFKITFNVTSKMMPLCHMLVYYLYGNEVVADNIDIKVVNEFENKVFFT